MNVGVLLHQLVALVVRRRNVNECSDRQRHISAVVEHVLVRYLSVGNLLVKAFVLIDGDLAFLSVPDGAERVNDLAVELDWIRNELRELLDCLFNKAVSAELTRLWQELKLDLGAPLEVQVLSVSDLVGAAAIRHPPNALTVVLLGGNLHVI